MKLELVNSNHRLTFFEEFESFADFEQLLNWTSGEFELHLQENKDGLKVYYPNGYFYMNLNSESKLRCDVLFISKCKRTLVQILERLSSVIHHFKKFKCSQ